MSNEDHGTGIPRVVKSILTNLYVSDRTGFEPVAVRLNNDGLLEQANGLAQQLDVVLPSESSSACRQVVTPGAGDVVLLLDSSWGALDRYRPTLDSARASGAVVVTSCMTHSVSVAAVCSRRSEAWFAGGFSSSLCAMRAFAFSSRSGRSIDSFGIIICDGCLSCRICMGATSGQLAIHRNRELS